MYGTEKECTESSYGAVESAKLLLEPFQTTEYDGEKKFSRTSDRFLVVLQLLE